MHSLEAQVIGMLERGQPPNLHSVGGVSALAEATEEIVVGRLMPEFLQLTLAAIPLRPPDEATRLADFACRCLEGATDEMVWREAVEILDASPRLPADYEDRCFRRFLDLAADAGLTSMARAAGLDVAFRWALLDGRRRLRLLVLLLDVQQDDEPIFLAHAAKIMGVAYSYWRESELVGQLRKLVEIDGVKDEAAFELGMAKMAEGIEAEAREKAAAAFEAAQHWFSVAETHREHRPDAAAYSRCLDVLTGFSRGRGTDELDKLADAIKEDAFQLDAWHRSDAEPTWLGARQTENACWNVLALRLNALAYNLEEPSWYEPGVIVEHYVLASYTANRSMLKRDRHGGVETLMRPRIESAMARQAGQVYALKQWLEQNTEQPWAGEARELQRRIDALIEGGDHPTEAASVWEPLAAILEQSLIPESAKLAVQSAILSSWQLVFSNLSTSESKIIETCLEVVSSSVDYHQNKAGRMLFQALLWWTVRFLRSRLEMTQKDDAGMSYLFEREDGQLPHEGALQDDYHRFLVSNLPGTEIEKTNVGSGRADVYIGLRGERIVAEVKRESNDSSFEALARQYGAQTVDYQGVSVRIGFLLVLDLTERREQGSPHLLTLVEPRRVVRTGDAEPRWVVIVKVPGRRLRPSDLTVAAKKQEAKHRSMRDPGTHRQRPPQ